MKVDTNDCNVEALLSLARSTPLAAPARTPLAPLKHLQRSSSSSSSKDTKIVISPSVFSSKTVSVNENDNAAAVCISSLSALPTPPSLSAICPTCGLKFSSLLKYREHLQQKHGSISTAQLVPTPVKRATSLPSTTSFARDARSCHHCKLEQTAMWRKDPTSRIGSPQRWLCNACYCYHQRHGTLEGRDREWWKKRKGAVSKRKGAHSGTRSPSLQGSLDLEAKKRKLSSSAQPVPSKRIRNKPREELRFKGYLEAQESHTFDWKESYSRIRVWSDCTTWNGIHHEKLFYDCDCNHRKPTQDLAKIRRHVMIHERKSRNFSAIPISATAVTERPVVASDNELSSEAQPKRSRAVDRDELEFHNYLSPKRSQMFPWKKSYSRIRVWHYWDSISSRSMNKPKVYYDCSCEARKPSHDLAKLRKHAESHEKIAFACRVCCRTFSSYSSLNAHMKAHKNDSASVVSSRPPSQSLLSVSIPSASPTPSPILPTPSPPLSQEIGIVPLAPLPVGLQHRDSVPSSISGDVPMRSIPLCSPPLPLKPQPQRPGSGKAAASFAFFSCNPYSLLSPFAHPLPSPNVAFVPTTQPADTSTVPPQPPAPPAMSPTPDGAPIAFERIRWMDGSRPVAGVS